MSRLASIAIALVAAIALTSCALTPATLRVTRFGVGAYADEFDPFDRTVSDPVAIREVEEALLSLPPVPSGTTFCGIGFGLRYRLFFGGSPKTSIVADVEADGCREAPSGYSTGALPPTRSGRGSRARSGSTRGGTTSSRCREAFAAS